MCLPTPKVSEFSNGEPPMATGGADARQFARVSPALDRRDADAEMVRGLSRGEQQGHCRIVDDLDDYALDFV
jgi:hypothetical protein